MADSPPTADPQVTILASSGEDTDSAYGEDAQSLTTSLSSSVWNYNYENGRRYNAFSKGTYWYFLSRLSPLEYSSKGRTLADAPLSPEHAGLPTTSPWLIIWT
jgi:hypothetical protein